MLNDITARDFALHPRTSKKKRLLGQDRYNICAYEAKNPGIKQEEITAQSGIERSTISKILKNKVCWLSFPENMIPFSKFRCAPLQCQQLWLLNNPSRRPGHGACRA